MLSASSDNEKIIKEALPPYHKAVQNSSLKLTLIFKHHHNNDKSTNINKINLNRKQQIIWFNPPFNLKTKMKIDNSFLNLLDKHFPRLG